MALGSEEGEGNGSEERMERGGQKGKDTCHVPESLNISLPHTPTLLSLTPQFRGPHSRLPLLPELSWSREVSRRGSSRRVMVRCKAAPGVPVPREPQAC